MQASSDYRGRFAPSPTGPLHFGSLVAAVGSYLDARHHQGKWLVRIEDLDAPRTIKGAADDILRTLEVFGLYWDKEEGNLPARALPTLLYQSQRTVAYEAALSQLQSIGAAYPCACSRKEIADSALHGIEGQIYPGTCRNGIPAGRGGRAWRVRTADHVIEFDDILQGRITQRLASEIGDFVVKRADGLFAYQLAVVVDDAFQRITHIVRGSDLLSSTPRQIYLQRLLGLTTPTYMHFPVAVNTRGEKLSKQTLATPVDSHNISSTLWRTLKFLRQQAPVELESCKPGEILAWAIVHWDISRLSGITQIAAE